MKLLKVRVIAAVAALAAGGLVAHGAAAQSRTTLLHDALHLSTEQEHAWADFQASAAPDAASQAQAAQAARLAPTLPTPRRLALIRAQMQADLSRFDRTAQAVNAFYAQLSPQQQATFDKETAANGQNPQR